MKLFFILAVLCFLFSISAGDSAEESSTAADVESKGPKVVFPRRKYIRRRFGANANKTPSPDAASGSEGNVTFSVSMSSSVSETQDKAESEERRKPERKPWRPKKYVPSSKPTRTTSTTTTRKPSTHRPFYPRTKKFTPFEFKKLITTTTTTTPMPNTNTEPTKLSTRLYYKRPMHPRLIFNKNRFSPTTTIATAATTTDQPPEPLKETPNASFKPKSRPHFLKSSNRPLVKTSLKKLFKSTTETTSTVAGREDSVEEAVPELSSTTSTTPTPPVQTTTPEPTTTTTTTTVPTTTTSTSTSTTTTTTVASNEYFSSSSMEETPRKDKDMIIIPVPPSQRKPYHPVIMQVTKTPSVSSTERPQTKVVTYKLNKMFVPMGIYGKVLQKSEAVNGTYYSSAGADLVTPTPKSFNKGTRTPQIRHKGTSSEEQLMTSSDESRDFATAVRPFDAMSSEADEIFSAQEWATHFQKPNKKQQRPNKQFMHASEVDLTMNYKPDISTISLTTQRPNINTISLTTTEVSSFNPMGSYKNHNSMTQMGPPRPFDKPSRPTSLVESIKSAAANAASSIPGLIHGGLTQLSQYAPFEDPVYVSSSPSPTKSSVTLGAPDVETLEYFRKRPHLIKPTSNSYAQQQGNNFQPSYSSGGFKPVTAPPHFAKSYYASTTTPSPSSTTSGRPSKDDSHKQQQSVGRSPKNVQDIRDSGNKKENSKEYVDHLVESSNKFKFSATASPFENDLIRNHWKELNEKYTPEDLQEASSNIYSLFSGPSPPSVEQMLYMKPPGHWSRTSTSAFHDLLKMFRLGFSYGQSATPVRMHVTTNRPYESYDNYKPKETYSTGNNIRSSTITESLDPPRSDGWRPLKSTSSFLKEPFLSFNAAISFRSTPKPTPVNPHGGSHYSSSSKPFIPGKFTSLKSVRGNPYSSSSHGSYVDAALADSYSGSKGHSSGLLGGSYTASTISPLHGGESLLSSYGDGSESYLGTSGGSLYSDGDSYGSKGTPLTLESYKPPSNTYASEASGPPKYIQKPSTPDYSDAYYGNHNNHHNNHNSHNSHKDSKIKYEAAHVEEAYSPPANFASLYENDPGIELIPSSAYYKAKEAGIIHSGEIAAVLKPETMSDDEIKSQLTQEVSNIPQLTYPNGKVPQQLQTLSQLNEYFQTSEPTSQNHVHFQPPLYRIIQQSMQSQAEQLSGVHQQAGLILNQPVDSQIQELFKAQEQPAKEQHYAEPSLTSFLGNGNHEIKHHHHEMPTRVQHHHSHHVTPEAREHTYEQLHFQPTQEYRQVEEQKPVHHHHHHQQQQPPQFLQQQLSQQTLQQLLQQQQHLQHQHHQQQQLQQQQQQLENQQLQQQQHQQLQHQHQQHQHQQLQHQQHQLQHQQHQPQLPQYLQPQPLHQQPPQQVVHKETSAAKQTQSGLSFTDFELPPGVDPDIASLLKAELDKDDIPEEFRKEFENQEKSKQLKEQSVGASNVKPTIVKPPAQRREDSSAASKTVFHKPIPIPPTLLTPSKRGRPVKPPPQIPKYVLDLARKLRTDKDLQGIVRVTSKKEGGPPIEYLYPVRG